MNEEEGDEEKDTGSSERKREVMPQNKGGC